MQLTKTSDASGKKHTLNLPLTHEAYYEGLRKMREGKMIQDAFPDLSPDQREFILTGITSEEWEELFPEE